MSRASSVGTRNIWRVDKILSERERGREAERQRGRRREGEGERECVCVVCGSGGVNENACVPSFS